MNKLIEKNNEFLRSMFIGTPIGIKNQKVATEKSKLREELVEHIKSIDEFSILDLRYKFDSVVKEENSPKLYGKEYNSISRALKDLLETKRIKVVRKNGNSKIYIKTDNI